MNDWASVTHADVRSILRRARRSQNRIPLLQCHGHLVSEELASWRALRRVTGVCYSGVTKTVHASVCLQYALTPMVACRRGRHALASVSDLRRRCSRASLPRQSSPHLLRDSSFLGIWSVNRAGAIRAQRARPRRDPLRRMFCRGPAPPSSRQPRIASSAPGRTRF